MWFLFQTLQVCFGRSGSSVVRSVWVSGCVCWYCRWAGGAYYYGLYFGETTVQTQRLGTGRVPLAENSGTGLLAWFPTQLRLQCRLCSCLDSLDSLTEWLRLGAIFSCRRSYELDSLPWQGSRMKPWACAAHCLGTQIRQECVLNSLVG